MNGETYYSGTPRTFNFSSTSGNFSISIDSIKEEDNIDDDEFNDYLLVYSVSNLTSGQPIIARTNYSGGGEWVEFTIVPTVTYKY